MPTVLLTRSIDVPEGCGAVWADERQTLDLALNHLWERGHRRIANVAGPAGKRAGEVLAGSRPAADIAVRRLEAYTEWMREHSVYDPLLIAFPQAWSAPQAIAHLRKWRSLPDAPTAVVCANDAQALDVIAAANALGLSVPGDLSVMGVDDSPEGRVARPALTSVEIPIETVGMEAVNALLRMLAGAPIQECRAVVPVTRLQVRDSATAPAQGGLSAK
jgi:DNA-binding LacI/PurR family transcriptional regulator